MARTRQKRPALQAAPLSAPIGKLSELLRQEAFALEVQGKALPAAPLDSDLLRQAAMRSLQLH